MLGFLTLIINHLWWWWWWWWRWWCSSGLDNEHDLMIWSFCVGFWLLMLLQMMASLPLRTGGHIFCRIRWCDTRLQGTWRLMYIQKRWRHISKTWFCTRLSKCTAILARDGYDGESYPRIIMMATVDDGLLSFFPTHSHNDSIVLVHALSLFWVFVHAFVFVCDVTFRSVDWGGRSEGVLYSSASSLLSSSRRCFLLFL